MNNFYIFFYTGDDFTRQLSDDAISILSTLGLPPDLTFRASFAAVAKARGGAMFEPIASQYNTDGAGPSVIRGILSAGTMIY